MSTPSTISVKIGNQIKNIYCHFDGRPSNNGGILLNHYNSQKLAEKVISLGDLSILDISMDKPEGHTFKHRVEGYSVAFNRDRGEKGTRAIVFNDYDAMMNYLDDNYTYNYYWDGEKWLINDRILTQKLIDSD